MSPTLDSEQYFDPFNTEVEFLPERIFDEMIERRYGDHGEVSHDYSLDNFLSDFEALKLDAEFTENFAAVEAMMNRMSQLCNHDHDLNAAMSSAPETDGVHDHDEHEADDTHDTKKCANCKKGKYCSLLK